MQLDIVRNVKTSPPGTRDMNTTTIILAIVIVILLLVLAFLAGRLMARSQTRPEPIAPGTSTAQVDAPLEHDTVHDTRRSARPPVSAGSGSRGDAGGAVETHRPPRPRTSRPPPALAGPVVGATASGPMAAPTGRSGSARPPAAAAGGTFRGKGG